MRFSRSVALFSVFVAATALAQDPGGQGRRTVEFANSNPTGYPPQGGSWSPDGKRLTFLASDSSITGEAGDIVQIDGATGKASVLATKAQLDALTSDSINEKDKDHRERYGMSSFLWADDSKHLLLDKGGKLWLYSIADGKGTLIVDTGAGSGSDAKFSPDAKSVSYLRGHNLYVHPVSGADKAKETALTTSGSDAMLNGEVDWIYLEELDVRSNYFWSPDSSAIAYLQMNEEKVRQYPIADWITTHATVDLQRYPQPGDPNPAVRVGIVPAKGGATKFIDVPFSAGNDSIPRFGWVDAETVYVEVLTRDNTHENVYFADTKTGKTRLAYSDTDAKYLDYKYDVTFLGRGQFVTTSWRDGYAHIYLYQFDEKHPLDADAKLVRQLTSGEYEVEGVSSFDEKSQTLFFSSDEGSPLRNNVWSIKLDGTGKRRVTTGEGMHEVMMSPDGEHFSDEFGNATTPTVARVCEIAGECEEFWKSKPITAAGGVTSEFVTLLAADGKTTLYGRLTRPTGAAAASVPLIMNPYGGPLATPSVTDGWGGGNLFNEVLAQHGFAVLEVDNRGMGGRGREFQQASYRNFGPVQFADQMAALDGALKRFPELDPKRVGWWGWSFGGTFTLYAMTHTDRIKAGVAVAPVTDFRNYDSIYTERYLGLPSANEDAYKAGSDVLAAKNLKGRVLIAHGTGDDNVHVSNTIQFIQPMIDAGIPYDLQLFPRKTHSIAGMESRNELFNRILLQFETYLK